MGLRRLCPQSPDGPAPTGFVAAPVRRLRLLTGGRMGFAHVIRPPLLGARVVGRTCRELVVASPALSVGMIAPAWR
jgi:hypothetical protein